MKIGGHDIDISSREKVFFPDAGLTKGDVIDYYDAIADTIIPHIRRYGVSMQRFPDGLQGGSFYNKNTPDYFPDWIRTVTVPKREGGSYDAPIVDSRAALIYLADQAVLTPHLYLARTDDLEHPDRMIYDLDPPEGTEDFSAVRQAALDVRSVLEEVDLSGWIMTTGSKGFHVVVPLDRSADYDQVRDFARSVATVLLRRHQDRYTLEQRKAKRAGRVFLDVLRNAYGATAVAPYAIRARPGAPVATPIEWEELQGGANPRDWTLQNVPDRIAQKGDPWRGMMRYARSLASRRETLDALLEAEGEAEEEKD
ncbi:MAG: ATP-dependent DNA ligase [candidate division WS1 bacterium]|jgi:bifunctional non-homologous end joining protein LigD|nr:ATP-dependent DNA ligase [candidate division WS1 bacterium]